MTVGKEGPRALDVAVVMDTRVILVDPISLLKIGLPVFERGTLHKEGSWALMCFLRCHF